MTDLDVTVNTYKGVFSMKGNILTLGSTIIAFVCDTDHAARIAALLNLYGVGDDADLAAIEDRGVG